MTPDGRNCALLEFENRRLVVNAIYDTFVQMATLENIRTMQLP